MTLENHAHFQTRFFTLAISVMVLALSISFLWSIFTFRRLKQEKIIFEAGNQYELPTYVDAFEYELACKGSAVSLKIGDMEYTDLWIYY